MALSANAQRAYEIEDENEFQIAAATTIWEGAAVGDNGSGYARGLVSGDPFLGFAKEKRNNSAGSAGDLRARLREKGKIQLAITSLAITDRGKYGYASDDGTVNILGQGTKIGSVNRFVSTGIGIVDFDAKKPEEHSIMAIPIVLAKLADGDIVTGFTPGFRGRIKSYRFIVTDPATTAAKLSTLNLEIGTTNLTGGVLALTSANCTPLGAVVAATAITGGNVFGPTDTISLEASATTAFVEGAGVLEILFGR